MSPDGARLQDARAWLAKADLDLKATAHEMTATESLWGDVMFHAPQAAEKSMKAFLAWYDVAIPKNAQPGGTRPTMCLVDAMLAPIADQAAPLTEYAWKFRYRGESAEAERTDAEAALAVARGVHGAILARMPAEAH